MSDSTTLTGIPPDRYRRIQIEAQKNAGIVLTGNAGTIKDRGVEVEYAYDGISTLTITVLKVPKIFGHEIISPDAVIVKVEKALGQIA